MRTELSLNTLPNAGASLVLVNSDAINGNSITVYALREGHVVFYFMNTLVPVTVTVRTNFYRDGGAQGGLKIPDRSFQTTIGLPYLYVVDLSGDDYIYMQNDGMIYVDTSVACVMACYLIP